MTTQSPQAQSIFPDYIRESPAVDKDGNLMPLWDWGLGALFQALQANFKNEGILVPSLSSTQLASIQGVYTAYIGSQLPQDQSPVTNQQNIPNISGQLVYCTDTYFLNQFVITYNTASPLLITGAQWVPLQVSITGSGNPNGIQAGVVGWQYVDLSGPTLYVCTTAGSSNGTPAPQAVWTAL